ncbi:uncharacterized protein V6R79_025508, partial [Siganus canaliculatus]
GTLGQPSAEKAGQETKRKQADSKPNTKRLGLEFVLFIEHGLDLNILRHRTILAAFKRAGCDAAVLHYPQLFPLRSRPVRKIFTFSTSALQLLQNVVNDIP